MDKNGIVLDRLEFITYEGDRYGRWLAQLGTS